MNDEVVVNEVDVETKKNRLNRVINIGEVLVGFGGAIAASTFIGAILLNPVGSAIGTAIVGLGGSITTAAVGDKWIDMVHDAAENVRGLVDVLYEEDKDDSVDNQDEN